jgi:hypothetical protein
MRIILSAINLIILPAIIGSLILAGTASGDISEKFDPNTTTKIVLSIYDNDGNTVSGSEMSQLTNGELYLTGPDNLPHYAIYDSFETLPTFRVIAGRAYRIHFLWEVPGFGKIMLLADNEGNGYTIENEGEQILLNLNYETAKSKVARLEADCQQYNSQSITVSESILDGLNLSKQHLIAAESYLSQTPSPDMPSAILQLNEALKYALSAHEQLYLDKAKVDIEKYRKGNITINVVDQSGQPLPAVAISYSQSSHDFIFSTTLDNNFQFPKEAGFNYNNIHFPYGYVEPAPGEFDWAWADGGVNSEARSGINMAGNTMWLFFHGWGNIPPEINVPEYLKNLTFEELKNSVSQHMYALSDRYKDVINIWEVLYEVCTPWSNELQWTWEQRLDVFKAASNAIKSANPDARIRLKDQAVPYHHFMGQAVCEPMDLNATAGWIPPGEFIATADSIGIPIDILGLQIETGAVEFYQDGTPNIHPVLDIVAISDLLDYYAEFDKQLMLESFNAPSTQIENGCWWHHPWNEQIQAEYATQVFTLAFSKPLSIGIDWEPTEDSGNNDFGGFINAEHSPKSAYFALKDLIASWTTSGTGETDTDGEFHIIGFAGDYSIVLKTADNQSYYRTIHIDEQQSREFTIELPANTATFETPNAPSQTSDQPKDTISTEESLTSKNNNLIIIIFIAAGIVITGLIVFFCIRKARST